MTRRMTIAVLALAGVFLATYLLLYKLGYIPGLACGTGDCEVVQSSRWAMFLGFPVALWGVLFYAAMFVVASAGSFGALAESLAVGRLLTVISGGGVSFSGWLTYLELAEIHAICRYCVVSAVLVMGLFALSLRDYRLHAAEHGAIGTD
jgi:uncharacterized membrane protein